ncbi:UDP-N-acetylmuramate dehydrogenase [Flavobacteriaceae bacterium MAR_2010_188]|nr:UDP-N-acetylmuramate dehydrogenase [Flavobacteriaceae bacterium MAR_2010_188]
MQIETNISLKPYNTFGIDVKAKKYVSINEVAELVSILKEYSSDDLFILSGGSNMLLTTDISSLVVHLNLNGIETVYEDDHIIRLKIAAGENWHKVVNYCLERDYGGIENLSLIPGNTGSTPIQNIGAYGVEIKDVLVSCDAINISNQQIRTFHLSECKFGYRDSVFKNELKGQYIITSVTLELTKKGHFLKTEYGAINTELQKRDVTNPTIQDISEAVVKIRSEKLPDPKEIGNSGSFFKNPIVSLEKYKTLKNNFEDIPSYQVSDSEVKIPAGWLIEKSGFKGKRFGEYGVHKNQALVLVNYGNASGNEIYQLSELIKLTIDRIFGIQIETEVNIF